MIEAWNYDMEKAPISTPILIWDEYWLMRVALWDNVKQKFLVDQPCCEEGEGQELDPICWQCCPSVPRLKMEVMREREE